MDGCFNRTAQQRTVLSGAQCCMKTPQENVTCKRFPGETTKAFHINIHVS